MSEQESKEKGKPRELVYAEQLIDENKYTEAIQVFTELGKKENISLYYKVLCLYLQSRILFWVGKYGDCLKTAEQAYKESLKLGKNLLTVDCLNVMIMVLGFSLGGYDRASELMNKAENLFKAIPKESSAEYKYTEGGLNLFKGNFFSEDDFNRKLKYLEHSLTLWEEIDAKQQKAITVLCIGNSLCYIKGEIEQAITYIDRGLAIAKEINFKYGIAVILYSLANAYNFKGEIDRALIYFKQSLKLLREINNKPHMAIILNCIGTVYSVKGEFDHALENLEESLAIFEEIEITQWTLHPLASGVEISLERGDIERAQQYFQRFEQINEQFHPPERNWSRLLKAMILKKSSRTRNKAKAEELLKQIVEEEGVGFELTLNALIHICDLLREELRITKDMEVLDELNTYIGQLLDYAEKSNSYWILCEVYLLQAKLALLELDMKTAQRFLTQAQQIAERFGLNQLATQIANENKDLLEKLDLWEKLKEVGAPMADRLELAHLDEQIEGMVQKRAALTAKVTEEKIAISKEKKVCLVCRGEVLRFSYICECGAIYCENCARALTNLENVCWACDVQIDYSKPIKLFKEEEVEVEEKAKKK
ncbi:MAG: tetratricopeptide repeat protein [Candidatus Lokiarchaeia archaeon]